MGSRQQRRFRKPAKHSSPNQSISIKVPLGPFVNQVPSGAPHFNPGISGSARRDSRQLQRAEVVTIPIAPTRSALLEQFRSNRNRDRAWKLKELFGHIVEFSGDQHGSRFIQQSIQSATDEERQKLFDEIFPEHVLNLMQDVFGNYVVQKLFEHGTPDQRAKMCKMMLGHVFDLSQHVYGCRVVQTAIDYASKERQNAFVRELERRLLECVENANGNHVIQKLVQRLASDQLHFIQIFCGHVVRLATHPYGCRVLQRCLENLSEVHTRSLLDELVGNCRQLMEDQYGNYVIQYVIANGSVMDRHFLVSGLHGRMMAMARHKFASNVVEKALVHSDPDVRRSLIDEFLVLTPDGNNLIQAMMSDQYANYVLQTALSVAEGSQKAILVTYVSPLLVNMRKNNSMYNKHLMSCTSYRNYHRSPH
ncbi:ARM repeat-containing protein [Schizopora paradoxa]|uniref:ARM repeat-containing protein n=1 Tax=Schizopora paradoxa TaxID=27342 RepID=A0A0H2RFN7_9AGAM|nr:ARM repeat-containing protein [Schizopora paradoxa]